VDLHAIVARVWPGGVDAVEPLGGGITNRNFRVDTGGDRYVLRIGGNDTHLLGIDRSVEHAATLAAARVGIGPEVVAFLQPEGYLVTRFIAGRPIEPEEMRRPENIRRTAGVLRRLHAVEAIPGRFDAFRVARAYRDTAARHGVRIPPAYADAQSTAEQIELVLGDRPLRPCHNDLLNANFLDEDGALRIVDWEYAGMGDVFFDLANFAVNHELRPDGDEALLAAYFGALREADLASLRLMRFMSDFREAMWGVVQQGISELDFDFGGYATEHFERLERTAGAPEFGEALGALRGSR
jgi:thiamine kinase-like enzyme